MYAPERIDEYKYVQQHDKQRKRNRAVSRSLKEPCLEEYLQAKVAVNNGNPERCILFRE